MKEILTSLKGLSQEEGEKILEEKKQELEKQKDFSYYEKTKIKEYNDLYLNQNLMDLN